MNGRVLKLGALGVLAVNLFFRGFGVSGNQKSKIKHQKSFPAGFDVGASVFLPFKIPNSSFKIRPAGRRPSAPGTDRLTLATLRKHRGERIDGLDGAIGVEFHAGDAGLTLIAAAAGDGVTVVNEIPTVGARDVDHTVV